MADDPPGTRYLFGCSKTALILVSVVVLSAATLFGPIRLAREAARRRQSRNNLMQIGLALHNYHETFSVLPPGAIVSIDGTRYRSWMTMLTPYLDASPLYNRINVNVPWDNPVNAAHFRQKYFVYLNPNVSTTVDAQGFALSHYAGNSHLFGDNSSESFPDITDGLAQTILAGEVAGNYTAWGYPRNWRDPGDGINTGPDSFGGAAHDGVNFLFADGHVQVVSGKIDPHVLQALGTPAGGESVSKGFVPTEPPRK